MAILIPNKVLTYLVNAITATDTQIVIGAQDYSQVFSAGLGDVYALLRSATDREIIKIDLNNSISGSYLTIARGQGGTIAAAWPTGTKFLGSTNADHYNSLIQIDDARTIDYNPNEVLTPLYAGEKVYQNSPAGCERWWKSYDGVNPYWDIITGEPCGTELYKDIGWTYDILLPLVLVWTLKKDLSNESPAQLDIRALTFDSANDKIIAGTQGYAQLWVSGDGGETWVLKKEIRSDTFQTHVNALTFDSANDKIIAGTRDDAQLWVSGDGGDTWALKKDLSNETPDQIYVNALTFDSTNDKIIAGTANDAQIWVSGDGGDTWALKKDLSNEVPDESYVSALTFDSANDKIIAGTRFNGQLWVSGDGGDTWALKKDLSNETPSHRSIDSLTFDSINDKIIASSSFGIGGYAQIWVSGDGGDTWALKKDFENVTPKQEYVYSLAFDSVNNKIIAGTTPDAQIWESTDGGDNWTLKKDLSDETPSQTYIYSLTFDSTNKRVIAGTGGDAQLWVEL